MPQAWILVGDTGTPKVALDKWESNTESLAVVGNVVGGRGAGARRARLSWTRLASEKRLILFFFDGNVGQYIKLWFSFPFPFMVWALGGALCLAEIHRWFSAAGIWNFQRTHRSHFIFLFMLCLCPAATSDRFRMLFQEWIGEVTGVEQKRNGWSWFWYFETRGISVGKVVICKQKREKEGRERGRKRGR